MSHSDDEHSSEINLEANHNLTPTEPVIHLSSEEMDHLKRSTKKSKNSHGIGAKLDIETGEERVDD